MAGSSATAMTELLARIERGDELATAALLPLLYGELRAMADGCCRGRARNQTLQPTALVHEAFLKLCAGERTSWESRAHFLAVAAMAMRQILANHAEAKRAQKRGGGACRVTLSDLATPVEGGSQVDLLDLHDALNRLGELSPRQARIVEMRYLTGLEEVDVAHVLGVSLRTVQREWRMAKAFLNCQLGRDAGP